MRRLFVYLRVIKFYFLADTGRINVGLAPIMTGFGGFKYALFIWALMQLTVFGIFPIFKMWSITTKKFFTQKGFLTTVWHYIGILSVITYQIGFVIIFTKMVVYFEMAQASSVAVLMELVRFLMKSHAFIRTNVPRVSTNDQQIFIF